MARVYSYYIANAKSEIKYAYKDLNNVDFEEAISQTAFPFEDLPENDEFEEEFVDDDLIEDYEEQKAAKRIADNTSEFDELVNITDIELRRILEIDVSVVIPAIPESTNHGDLDFDIDSIVDRAMRRRRLNQIDID